MRIGALQRVNLDTSDAARPDASTRSTSPSQWWSVLLVEDWLLLYVWSCWVLLARSTDFP
jgi:hypothetical protein